MAVTKIKWLKPVSWEPFYCSDDGRFEIAPLFLGRERPQGWKLLDNKTGRRVNRYFGLKDVKELAKVWLSEIP